MENNKGIEVHDRSAAVVELEGGNDDAIRRSAMRKISIRLLPLLALAEGVAQLQKVNISYAAPGIKKTLNINNDQLGLALSILFLTYPLAMVPMTMLGKRFGPRKFIPVSLLLIAAFSMLQTIMPNFGSFVAMRALLGVAEAGMFPMFKYTLSMFYGKTLRIRAREDAFNVDSLWYHQLAAVGVDTSSCEKQYNTGTVAVVVDSRTRSGDSYCDPRRYFCAIESLALREDTHEG